MFIHIILEFNPNKGKKNTSILMLCWFLYICVKNIFVIMFWRLEIVSKMIKLILNPYDFFTSSCDVVITSPTFSPKVQGSIRFPIFRHFSYMNEKEDLIREESLQINCLRKINPHLKQWLGNGNQILQMKVCKSYCKKVGSCNFFQLFTKSELQMN